MLADCEPDESGAEPREYSLPRGVHVNVQPPGPSFVSTMRCYSRFRHGHAAIVFVDVTTLLAETGRIAYGTLRVERHHRRTDDRKH
jgi:hypothetical protein